MAKRIEQLRKFYENNPKEPFVLFALAKEYDKMEDYANSELFFEDLYQNHATYTGQYYHYGTFLLQQEKIEKAQLVMKKGLEICKTEKDNHAFSELSGLYFEHFDDDDE